MRDKRDEVEKTIFKYAILFTLVCFLIFMFLLVLITVTYGSPVETWIKHHEGLELNIYLGPENNLLIGYGHNLAHGIDEETADFQLYRDICRAEDELRKIFSKFSLFPLNVRIVLTDMMCAMGPGNKKRGFKSFKNMIFFVNKFMWDEASGEILKSKWADVYTTRAKNNARLMVNTDPIYGLLGKKGFSNEKTGEKKERMSIKD